jgi:hypothetical protein
MRDICAQILDICAPESTNKRYLCSRSESTNAPYLCPREHTHGICAPWSTNENFLCPREQKIFAMQVLVVMRKCSLSCACSECLPPLCVSAKSPTCLLLPPKFCPYAAGKNARAQSGD